MLLFLQKKKTFLTGLFLLLVLLRIPRITLEGRLWAEEGPVFYLHAATHHWAAALAFSYMGYINLGANLAALAARLVPLEYAPRVTFAFALLAQICPALLLTGSRTAWLGSRGALPACLLILATVPAGEEVWLNTLHSQFHLALCVALILALDLERGGWGIFHRILLLLAPLFGPVAVMALPLFAVRAALDRSWGRLNQTLALAAGSAIQLIFFYHRVAARPLASLKLLAGMVFIKNLIVPLAGFGGARPVAEWLGANLARGHLPLPVPALLLLAILLLVLLARRGPAAAGWLFAAAGVIAAGSYAAAYQLTSAGIDPEWGQRYQFVPQVLAAWGLVAVACGGNPSRALIAAGLAAWIGLVSAGGYLHPASFFASGPSWRAEVAKWRRDPGYAPHVWPAGWAFALPRV